MGYTHIENIPTNSVPVLCSEKISTKLHNYLFLMLPTSVYWENFMESEHLMCTTQQYFLPHMFQ
jgi:hypothetical protein